MKKILLSKKDIVFYKPLDEEFILENNINFNDVWSSKESLMSRFPNLSFEEIEELDFKKNSSASFVDVENPKFDSNDNLVSEHDVLSFKTKELSIGVMDSGNLDFVDIDEVKITLSCSEANQILNALESLKSTGGESIDIDLGQVEWLYQGNGCTERLVYNEIKLFSDGDMVFRTMEKYSCVEIESEFFRLESLGFEIKESENIVIENSVKEELVATLILADVDFIKRELLSGESEFTQTVLHGEGWTQYSKLTDEQLLNEFNDRKDELINDGYLTQDKAKDLSEKALLTPSDIVMKDFKKCVSFNNLEVV